MISQAQQPVTSVKFSYILFHFLLLFSVMFSFVNSSTFQLPQKRFMIAHHISFFSPSPSPSSYQDSGQPPLLHTPLTNFTLNTPILQSNNHVFLNSLQSLDLCDKCVWCIVTRLSEAALQMTEDSPPERLDIQQNQLWHK